MKHRVRVSAPFSFRGKTFHPEIVLDIERFLAEGKVQEDIHPMLAAANGIGGYSYEYEMLEAAPLHFDRPEGLVGEFLAEGRLDLDGLRAALQRQKRLELLAGLAREKMKIESLEEIPGLAEALLAAYEAGRKNTSG